MDIQSSDKGESRHSQKSAGGVQIELSSTNSQQAMNQRRAGQTSISITSQSSKQYAKSYLRERRQDAMQHQIQSQVIFRKWRRSDNFVAFFSNFGLFANIIMNGATLQQLEGVCQDEEYFECKTKLDDTDLEAFSFTAIESLVLLFSIISICFLIRSHHSQIQWFKLLKQKQKQTLLRQSAGNIGPESTLSFGIQIFILILFPVPFIASADFRLITIIMFFRFYFLIKCYFNYSGYRDMFSKQVCIENNFYPSNWFILKTKARKQPIKTWFQLFIVIAFFLQQLFLLIEPVTFLSRGGNPQLKSIYFTVITITTVGYGDYTPWTTAGQMMSCFAAMLGIVQVSFLLNAIANWQKLDEHEYAALTKIEKSNIAAKAISHSVKFYSEKKKQLGFSSNYGEGQLSGHQALPRDSTGAIQQAQVQNMQNERIFGSSLQQRKEFMKKNEKVQEQMNEAIGQWKDLRIQTDKRMHEQSNKVHIQSKLIKKEVFEISDTMDVMAQVLQGDSIEQVKEKIQNMQNQSDYDKSYPQNSDDLGKQVQMPQQYMSYSQMKGKKDQYMKLISRHSKQYDRAVEAGKYVSSSNRNAVLLGQQKFVRNTGLQEGNPKSRNSSPDKES